MEICLQDADFSECFCGWCGRSSDLLSCKSCDMLFCNTCILRNFGEECLSRVKLSGWQCCCCSPSVLGTLTLQLYKAMEADDVIVSSSDSESDTSVSDVDIEIRWILKPEHNLVCCTFSQLLCLMEFM